MMLRAFPLGQILLHDAVVQSKHQWTLRKPLARQRLDQTLQVGNFAVVRLGLGPLALQHLRILCSPRRDRVPEDSVANRPPNLVALHRFLRGLRRLDLPPRRDVADQPRNANAIDAVATPSHIPVMNFKLPVLRVLGESTDDAVRDDDVPSANRLGDASDAPVRVKHDGQSTLPVPLIAAIGIRVVVVRVALIMFLVMISG